MIISKQKILLIKEKDFEYAGKLTSIKDTIKFLNDDLRLQDEAQEVIYLLILNNSNRLISFFELARGGSNCSNFSMLELFKSVLICNCNRFILVHNHPSGESTPSSEDIRITKKIIDCAEIFGFYFVDHIVVGNNGYQSCMKEAMKEKNI